MKRIGLQGEALSETLAATGVPRAFNEPMQTIDLAKTGSLRSSSAALRVYRDWSFWCAAASLFFVISFSPPRTIAQDDVAEAARQARAKKEEQKKAEARHVYTEEDLRKPNILTREDQVRIEAKRKRATSPAAEEIEEPLDAKSATPEAPLPLDAPLGDVARHYRILKQAGEQTARFHLPVGEPSLASPVAPVAPRMSAPAGLTVESVGPKPPRVLLSPKKFVPSRRSPFERPELTQPFVMEAPKNAESFARRSRPTRPAMSMTSRPKLPAATAGIPSAPRVSPLGPSSPALAPNGAMVAMPSHPAKPVKPAWTEAVRGPGRIAGSVFVNPGDSLWKLALRNLGDGTRWQELLAVNPGIENPDRIRAGMRINLPTSGGNAKAEKRVTVQRGDTLSQIAQSALGHASYAGCIARANPQIHNADRIYGGEVLTLPAVCQP